MATTPDTLPYRSTNLQRTIVLHDKGDAILLVGPGDSPQPILVSKTAMSMASPVWKAMFDRQRWTESSATEIPFPDDDVDAMLIVLRIAHLRFSDLPSEKPFKLRDLLQLAVLCDKYDVVKLVRPFLDLHHWTRGLIPNVETRINCHPSWLFIAWTFGYKDTFVALAKHLVSTLALDSEQGVATFGKPPEEFPNEMPPGLLESMLIIREETIAAMLETCYGCIDFIMKSDICQVKDSTGNFVDEPKCRAMILGSYIEFLVSINMYPNMWAATNVEMSVEEMQACLGKVVIQTYTSHDYSAIYRTSQQLIPMTPNLDQFFQGRGLNHHTKCGEAVDLVDRIRRMIPEMPSPILESHLVHMDEQARK